MVLEMKKPLPPIYFLLGLVAMTLLHFLWPVGRYLVLPWTLSGIVPLAVGIGLNMAADRQFKRFDTTVKPFEESSALLTVFPFSFTRNPMYLGLTLMLVGVALLFGTVSPLVVVVAFTALIDRAFVRAEERMLAERFGAAWNEYRERVRRWL